MRISFQNFILSTLIKLTFKGKRNFNYKKIIIHRVGSIGDTVVSLPAIFSLKEKFPESKIFILFCNDHLSFNSIKKLTSNYIDGYYEYSLKSKKINNFINILKEIRKEKFDLWLSLPQDLSNFRQEFRNILFASISSSKSIFGFRVNIDKKTIRDSKLDLHENEKIRLLNVAQELSSSKLLNKLPSKQYIDISKINFSKDYFKSKNIFNNNLLVICIGSNRLANKWNYVNYQFIIKKWILNEGSVVLLGGKNELDYSKKISEGIDSTLFNNFVGLCDIYDSTLFLSKANLVLGNDTGMMHIADLMYLNIVSIFSSRDFKGKWYPTNSSSDVFRPNIECSCFLKNECFERCVDLNKKEEVWEFIKKKYL